MKTIRTPKQVLQRDRARKTIYREALHAQGWRAHTVWIKDESWAVVAEYLRQHGLSLGGPRVAKVKVTSEGSGGEIAPSGSIAVPQHTQPDTKEAQ